MLGLMQEWSLTVNRFLDHASENFPERELVSRSADGTVERATYHSLRRQAMQVTNGLRSLGLKAGDRASTLAANTLSHLEIWYGVNGAGGVLHTANPRLPEDQLIWTLNHAESRCLFFDHVYLAQIERILPQLPRMEWLFCMGPEEDALSHLPDRVRGYREFKMSHPDAGEWASIDESSACGICYTSGTTGNPKGVVYSHKSNILHALTANQPDAFGVRSHDVVLPIVPMYHANAWALTYIAPMVGAKLVLPGPALDGESLYNLIEAEKVTFAAAVPTVWQSLLDYLEKHNLKLTSLQRALVGGAAVPGSCLRALEADHGVAVMHAWGMTELSPVGTIASFVPAMEELSPSERAAWKLKQGRPLFAVEMKIVDQSGNALPNDGRAMGRLMVRGPSIARGYLKGDGATNDDGTCLEPDGYFDTGDIASIDRFNFMEITDRAKDVIKSGGEWISSIAIENAAMSIVGVARAAVIAMAHPKWGERPLLVVQRLPGASLAAEHILDILRVQLPSWWMPDKLEFVESIPLGATGKTNKAALRQAFKRTLSAEKDVPVSPSISS